MRFHSQVANFFLTVTLVAQPVAPASKSERLASVGKLWCQVKWLHPALATGEVDWDQALVLALPKLQAADTPEALQKALETLMAPLHDPALRIGNTPMPRPVLPPEGQPLVEWMPGDVALVHLHHANVNTWDPGHPALQKAVNEALRKAKGLIFDLRPVMENRGTWASENYFKELVPRLIGDPLQLPAERYRYHSGYRAQRGITSGSYFSGQLAMGVEQVSPAKDAHPLPMVFIVNESSGVPKVTLGLQKAGKAWILAEGQPSAAWVVPTSIEKIGEKTAVEFSTGEILFADGRAGFGPDSTVEPNPTTGMGGVTAQAALKLLQGSTRPGATVVWHTVPALPMEATEPAHSEMTFPTLPWRQLAVIKFWGIINAFFPYMQHMDRPWSEALPLFLTRMEKVNDAREYALALAEMATFLQDSHVNVFGPEIRTYTGEAPAGLRMAEVEGRIAITGFIDESLKKEPGLHVGDVLLRVDGEDVKARIHRLSQMITASNERGRVRKALRYLLNGPEGSPVKILVQGTSGPLREVSIPRKKSYFEHQPSLRQGPLFKVLAGNIGYADLDRLENKDVPSMFEALKDTKALIFDMRGYPHGTAWTIAPWLNVKAAKLGATFRRNTYSGIPSEGSSHITFDQSIPTSSTKSPYKGKVVMLINQETQSQAEHTGLFFEAACGATFIGTPSAGADGDVTNLLLPGDIGVSFSGHDVRHADGRQLQRVGLQPHIRVAPTLKGLREGRDEVLVRAEQFLRSRK